MTTTLLAVFLILAALPVVAEVLRRPAKRGNAPGDFATLPSGVTHYRWHGPEDGPVAVCIHGLSTPSYVFAATERSLASLGYRVLSYDLYGRGYSGRPPGRQTSEFFCNQLNELLDDQGVEPPMLVIGYSMGGAVAAAFAATERYRISKLVLIAPAGLLPVYDDFWGRLFVLPVIGDWATRVIGGWMLRRELVEHRSNATIIPNLEDRQAEETHKRGFLPALLSSRRYMLGESRDKDHREIARTRLPVLAIWGAEDPVIPLKSMGRLAELNPDAHHAQVAGAGHLVLQTHPAQVSEALRKFVTED